MSAFRVTLQDGEMTSIVLVEVPVSTPLCGPRRKCNNSGTANGSQKSGPKFLSW